jgi:hypothetical protein
LITITTAARDSDPGPDPRLTQIRLRALIKRRKQLLTEDDFAVILAIRRLRTATIQEIDPCAFSGQ